MAQAMGIAEGKAFCKEEIAGAGEQEESVKEVRVMESEWEVASRGQSQH